VDHLFTHLILFLYKLFVKLAFNANKITYWTNHGPGAFYFILTTVLIILGIPRSTYYYQKNYKVEEKQVSEGRPAPGYSITKDGKKISDEQIKEWLLEEIEGDAYAYGYRKLTKQLRQNYDLIVNKKKI
jgi:hypothetical protein